MVYLYQLRVSLSGYVFPWFLKIRNTHNILIDGQDSFTYYLNKILNHDTSTYN